MNASDPAVGAAKPVLITAGAEASGFPSTACLRVDAGGAEEEMLAEFMIWLARFADDARAIG